MCKLIHQAWKESTRGEQPTPHASAFLQRAIPNEFPQMPLKNTAQQNHRPKYDVDSVFSQPGLSLIAKQLSNKEWQNDTAAQEAVFKELKGLRGVGTWGEDAVNLGMK